MRLTREEWEEIMNLRAENARLRSALESVFYDTDMKRNRWGLWRKAGIALGEYTPDAESADTMVSATEKRLRNALDVLLAQSQVLRINQVQACAEMFWPEQYTRNCDEAWRIINETHQNAIAVKTG